MVRSLLFGLAAATLASAHFELNWPPTAGFNDDEQPNAPCGGATVTVDDSAPEINVDRFAASIFSSHPAGSWSFFATTNTQEPYNFTEIVPVINSTGVGTFCLNYLRAPADFAGQSGVLQVIDSSVDGTLYQCAPVKFVSGANNTVSEFCTNQTSGFTAEWTSESSSVEQGSSSSNSSQGESSPSSSTSAAGAAAATAVGSVLGLGLLAAGLAF
ncbi:hypothetical protein CKM354_000050900 [Cercospora kikuchii]|uniref:Copper acquisition factor BIM1-like domain-containing protein n=1 Tax=Cercospora kikuchii TaxID=84275 RepID=A0A9P3C6E5_9PEZI|nr:uncharacterized protein CKM354_000050900 [Cercospora kikuchii]GIZ37046.1 hypothetical protein CKM354_000050900 [Cercospora kikuchii]